jgi:phospholipid/cholesterol/gamma-HCH transport system permease protein
MNPDWLSLPFLVRWGRQARAAWLGWWNVILIGAQIMVLAASPSSYRQGRQRTAVLTHLVRATLPQINSFLVLSALVSLVLIRIVVATAMSYGLSQYALEVLVRTLVLELIPLYAAMFVALRYALPGAQELRRHLADRLRMGELVDHQQLLRTELLPRALGASLSVMLLAGLSGVIALLLTYLNVYGLSHWGLPEYTRGVGSVFTPAVSLIFVLKTLFFSLAVAIVPFAASAQRDSQGRFGRRSDISEFARLLSVILIIEVISLVGNYY